MHILQIGLPKSGNFWLYSILKQILQAAHIEQRSFIRGQPIYQAAQSWDMGVKGQIDIDFLDITSNSLFYRIGNIFRYPVDDLAQYINRSTMVWSHSQSFAQTRHILSQFDKVIYIMRDPRDVAVSWANFVFTPYMCRYYPWLTSDTENPKQYLEKYLLQIIDDWAIHVGGYVQQIPAQNIHYIFYEQLVLDFQKELERLLQYLQIVLSKTVKQKIAESVAFKTMQQDNPKHLRRGNVCQWLDVLTKQQVENLLPIVGPLLNLFHYPLNDQLTQAPKFPTVFKDYSTHATDKKVKLLIPAPH